MAFSNDEEEDQREASAESDGDYATIPPQPVAPHQRPRGNRRPPVRFPLLNRVIEWVYDHVFVLGHSADHGSC